MHTMEDRLTKVESANRRLRLLLNGMVGIVVVACVLGVVQPPPGGESVKQQFIASYKAQLDGAADDQIVTVSIPTQGAALVIGPSGNGYLVGVDGMVKLVSTESHSMMFADPTVKRRTFNFKAELANPTGTDLSDHQR